jgi:RNA polymerase sigma factor (TIGR02999 family)
MDAPEQGEVSRLLLQMRDGDEAVLDRLMPLVYAELHAIASRHMRDEHAATTFQTTALIHEAYLRLVGADVQWEGRRHFLAIAARTMRRILVDHARKRRRIRHGGGESPVTLTANLGEVPRTDVIDVIAVDDALAKLSLIDERKAKVVELHYFGGLNYEEIGEVLEISIATVHRDLRFAVSWLHAELNSD